MHPKKLKHCIVTPDAIGPVKNGGIGTHCYFLAKHLAKEGHDVTLLFTYPVEKSVQVACQKIYEQINVQLIFLCEKIKNTHNLRASHEQKYSYAAYTYLREQQFDQIHFQDWLAHGFHCIQAKRTLGEFSKTLFTVTAHGSTEWAHEGMECWNENFLEGSKLAYAERYCVTFCDILISPSAYMLTWLQEKNIPIPEDTRLIPYCYYPESSATDYAYIPKSGVIAFFGRLETRKGLEIFCSALNLLSKQDKERIQTIYFLGKNGKSKEDFAQDYIKKHVDFPHVEIHTNLDSFSALKFLQEQKALIFTPSLMDNLPYAVLECACLGMPIFASNVGGIPEILPKSQLFEPTATAIQSCLSTYLENGLPAYTAPLYTMQKAKEGWELLTQEQSVLPEPSKDRPLVSVCMAHYNHGKYLEQALDALAAQDYDPFEVIVYDDGSTDKFSLDVFEKCTQKYDERFQFLRKHNEGLGATRNACVAKAQGSLLVFCDADNVSMPHMLSYFVKAINQGTLDIATCHNHQFPENIQDTAELFSIVHTTFMGADVVTGLMENVFGDANFMVKTSVFHALNGFTTTKDGYEDWEFLARATLSGYVLDVIPQPIFWYRVTKDGMSQTISKYRSLQLVRSAYKLFLPEFGKQACDSLLIPFRHYEAHTCAPAPTVIIRLMLNFGVWLEKKYVKLFPAGSKRQLLASAVWNRFFSQNKG